MRIFTADEAKRNFREFLKVGGEEFVAISKHGRRVCVVVPPWAFDTYEMIRQAHVQNRVLLLAESAAAKVLEGDQSALKVLRVFNARSRDFLESSRPIS